MGLRKRAPYPVLGSNTFQNVGSVFLMIWAKYNRSFLSGDFKLELEKCLFFLAYSNSDKKFKG